MYASSSDYEPYVSYTQSPMLSKAKIIASLQEARTYLTAFQCDGANDDEEPDEVVIAEKVSLKQFMRFLKSEPNLPAQIRLVDGKIIAYEVPRRPHGVIATEVTGLIRQWNGELLSVSQPDIIISPAGTLLIADSAIDCGRLRPPYAQRCDSEGAPYPTMVVEVGYSESLPSLHRLAAHYFSARTNIQVYLAIKIYPRRPVGGARALLAALYLRTSPIPTVPVVVKSFGTVPLANSVPLYLRGIGVPDATITGVGRHGAAACNAAGLPMYQINIPAAHLFNGAPAGVPAAAAGGYNLDLWNLQDIIRRVSVSINERSFA